MDDKVPVPDDVLQEIIAKVREDLRVEDMIAVYEGLEPADESEHFYLCKACGQPVDMRNLVQVFHHEDKGHAPLPAEDAEDAVRMQQIAEKLAAKESRKRMVALN